MPDAALQTEIAKLLADRQTRDRRGLFFAEGVRNVIRAADAGMTFHRVIFSDRLLINPVARKLVRRMRQAAVPTVPLSPEGLREISRAERASGVAATVRQRWARLNDVRPDNGLCWILLDRVRSPGNLGTLIRSSEAAGGAGFILIGPDPYAPAVVRAAMGALYRQRFVRTNWPDLRLWLARHRVPVIGAAPDGAEEMHACDWPRRAPLLV